MGRLELRLLGIPRVLLDGREISFRTRKALALLAFLAAEGGMHRREALAELLWPASTRRRGRTALRGALASIRRTLGEEAHGSEGGLLKIEGDLLGVRPGLYLDLDAVRRASETSSAGVRSGGTNGASILASADAAYRGEFLEGFSLDDAPEFDLWAETQRGLWRARIGEVLNRLADRQAEEGDLAAAAGTAERWVARDPAEWAARVKLMEARAAAGDPRGALSAYEEYRSGLRRLGLKLGPEAENLAARIRADAEAARNEEDAHAPGTLRMPLVGRKDDFKALVEEYRAARAGTARSVVVLGEAGIGKTRLVEEFLSWAASKGADTLRGGTFETGTRLPYGPLVDALRPRLERERAPDDLLEDRWLAELSRILPELRDRYPDLPSPTADEASARALLLEALARLGAALAGGSPRRNGTDRTREPLVLFVDDAQWADGASRDALRYCSRGWARDGVPLLLIVGAREEDLGTDDLGRWLLALGREAPLKRLALAPVEAGDIDGLLRLLAGAGNPGDDGALARSECLGRWLHQESGGLPLFLTEILNILLERGVLIEHAGREGRREIVRPEEGFDEERLRGLVPAWLRELIQDKLRPLSDAAADVLTAGAVLGRGFGFGTLVRVARVGETEGLAAIDGLVAARLLEEVGTPSGESTGTAYAFTHDKIRDVACTEAGGARREIFHRRALEHLTGRGAPAAELARHALAAGLSEGAFGHLLAAGDEAMAVFAAGDAVVHYERAQELLVDVLSRPSANRNRFTERLRLYGGLGHARVLVYDWGGAREAYEVMLAVAEEAGDREAEWEALNGLGVSGAGFIHGPEEDELLRGHGRRKEWTPTRASGGAKKGPHLAGAGNGLSLRAAREYAERALLLARDLGREDLQLRSEFGLGVGCGWAGMWEEAATYTEEALSVLAASGNEGKMEPPNLAGLLWSSGVVAFGKGLIHGPAGAFGPTSALWDYWRESAERWEELDTDYARAQLGCQSLGYTMAGEYEAALDRGLRGSRSLAFPGSRPVHVAGPGGHGRRPQADVRPPGGQVRLRGDARSGAVRRDRPRQALRGGCPLGRVGAGARACARGHQARERALLTPRPPALSPRYRGAASGRRHEAGPRGPPDLRTPDEGAKGLLPPRLPALRGGPRALGGGYGRGPLAAVRSLQDGREARVAGGDVAGRRQHRRGARGAGGGLTVGAGVRTGGGGHPSTGRQDIRRGPPREVPLGPADAQRPGEVPGARSGAKLPHQLETSSEPRLGRDMPPLVLIRLFAPCLSEGGRVGPVLRDSPRRFVGTSRPFSRSRHAGEVPLLRAVGNGGRGRRPRAGAGPRGDGEWGRRSTTVEDEVRRALDIDRASTARECTVDITTIGAKTGRPQRIEIWFHKVYGRWYLSSIPARRDWYSNLRANPRFTFHVKHGAHADLAATAVPLTDPAERRRVFEYIVDDFNQSHNPARVRQPQRVEEWMEGSPLVEIIFDDLAPDREGT